MPIQVGDKAPHIKTTDFSLADAKGQPVVLFFFPKADTPGCTKEAQGFSENSKKFAKAGAVVLGVSPDKPAALAKFKEKYNLSFTLLSDVDHTVAEAYGTWVEKSMYGRTYMGVARTTYLIAPDGTVARRWDDVKVNGHAADVLRAVGEL